MIWHLRYLWYVLVHKWYVYRAGRALGVGRWQLLIHDLSKFEPVEWFAYVERMRDGRASTWESTADTDAYRRAWAHHWQSNPHHHEYWTAINPRWHHKGIRRTHFPLAIPLEFILEMAADKYGAGKAQAKPDIAGWWQANKHRHQLHPESLALFEATLRRISVLQDAGRL